MVSSAESFPESLTPAADLSLDIQNGWLRSKGTWTLPHIAGLERRLEAIYRTRKQVVVWEVRDVTALDTAGAWLIERTILRLQQAGRRVELLGLRESHRALLGMLSTNATALTQPRRRTRRNWLEAIGRQVWSGAAGATTFLQFIGESVLTSVRLLLRPQCIRVSALFQNVQAAGAQALPIIGLLSFLVGVVIAYQSAVQLRQYGANIYIADLVGLAMLRELAGLMTAVIVAGRSGSAFTAQIGTMQITEEIDALRTIGISPIELLVVPKVWGLMLALPLLTVFSDMMSVLGGMLMAKMQLGLSFATFLDRFRYAVTVTDFLVGVSKAPVFAIIIALVGCYQGFRVHGGADSVGHQTTVSVVQGIFLVIMADALFSIAFSWFGI
jgi:phospholipid/cholesterol/gamma-HCH transport system permease protein